MSKRSGTSGSAVALVMAIVLFAPAFVAAQSGTTTKPAKKTATITATATRAWTMPRTPDGQPDLQGYWSSLSFTPMQRPVKYGNREFLTDEELSQMFKEGVQHEYEYTFDHASDQPYYDPTVYALGAWQNGVKPNKRTSLIVDPPDGRFPPLTPEAKKARAMKSSASADLDPNADPEAAEANRKADSPADLGLGVRCLTFGGPPPILPRKYNSNTQIVQGAGYVLIEAEWGSEPRIIPLDGRPHLSRNIHGWHGDSRGHWEGDTLVVETTNFRPDAVPQNANAKTLKITEYFTRSYADTIEYKFTVDDPSTWTKPWTAIIPLSRSDGPMFEYACSEGNNALINILAGAREADRGKATGASGTPISQK